MHPFARRTYGTLVRVTERVYLFRNVVNSVIVLGDHAMADRKSTRLNSSHIQKSRMPSSA